MLCKASNIFNQLSSACLKACREASENKDLVLDTTLASECHEGGSKTIIC